MNKYLIATLKISLVIISVTLLVFFIYWLPNMLRVSSGSIFKFTYLKFFILLITLHTLIAFFIAIHSTLKLLKLVDKNLPFTEEACKSFNTIIVAAIGMIVLFVTGIVYLTAKKVLSYKMYILGMVIVLIIFIIAGLTSAFKIFLKKMAKVKGERAKIEKEKKLLS